MLVWAVSTAGASVVKTSTQPAKKRLAADGCLFYVPADICSGPIGLLRVQTIGAHPAPHLMLAARRAERHRQRAERGHFLAFQGGAQFHRRSRRVMQDDTEGIQPDNEVGSLRDRHTHALALGIAAVCYGDIAWRQGKMLECFAGVDIAANTSRNCKDKRSIAIWRRWLVPVAPGA